MNINLKSQSALEINSLKLRLPLSLIQLSQDKALLVSDTEYYILEDRKLIFVLSLVDGKRSELEIVKSAAKHVADFRVLELLSVLKQKGLIEEHRKTRLSTSQKVFWHHLGYPSDKVIQRFSECTISLVNINTDKKTMQLMYEALVRLGLRVDSDKSSSGNSSVQLVVVDSFLNRSLEAINTTNQLQGRSWCFVQITGVNPFISPSFHSSTGPCFSCLRYWLSVNRPVETYLHRRGKYKDLGEIIAFEPAIRIVSEFGAIIAGKMVLGDKERYLRSELTFFDSATQKISHHTVRKRPQCPICGDSSLMQIIGERPIVIRNISKKYWDDGGYRCQSPDQTHKQFAHVVNDVTGVVNRLLPMPQRHTSTRPLYVSGYCVIPNHEKINSQSFQRICAGKGRSAEQARMSALGEAIERFSGVYQGDEAFVRASLNEMGERALSPLQLLNYSDRQYAQRKSDQSDNISKKRPIPLRYNPDTQIDWTPAWSLTYNTRRYIPLSYCYSEAPTDSGINYCGHIGNGVAAGSCIEEAILQGLFELVERDAVAVWWYNRIERPGVDLASFKAPFFERLIEDYNQQNWQLWVLDLTHDIGIQTFAALACSKSKDRFSIGFGCHLETELAVQRALTELNQLFDPKGELRQPWDVRQNSIGKYLFPNNTILKKEHFPLSRNTDMRDDILHCIELLSSEGLELIAVDKTRPDIGLNVVHVIVPGLRHFWPQFAPGRLYKVPVKMGWLSKELSEEELNPLPLLL